MNSNAEILLEWKRGIEAAKSTLSELTGKESMLKEQLMKEFGCRTILEAEKKLEELEKEIEKMGRQLTEGIETLQDEFDEINK